MSNLALLVVVSLLTLTTVVLVVDLVAVNPRCVLAIRAWARRHGYCLTRVRRQWVGRDVTRRADGTVRNVHSRPGGRYFVVSATTSSGARIGGRLRVEGGFQGYAASRVVELVVRELDVDAETATGVAHAGF